MKNNKPPIHFYKEESSYILPQKKKIRAWILNIVESHGFSIEEVNYTFCSDEYLHKINLEYLEHDTLTDIITFDHSHHTKQLMSDIFISIDRIKSNAKELNIRLFDEILRVMIHGILHLMGFNDHNINEREQMRNKEDECVYLFHKNFNKNI